MASGAGGTAAVASGSPLEVPVAAASAPPSTNVVRETNKKWLRGMLGGVSNAFAIVLVSPLDVLKIRFQVQNALVQAGAPKTYDGLLKGARTIIANEGLRGLFKGLSVSMLRELTFSSARMGLYEPIRNYLVGPYQVEIALHQKITAGLISGAIAAALFNPTDVLKVRFQADTAPTPAQRRYQSVRGAVTEIVRSEGFFGGLYKGVGTTILRASLLTSAQMASYDESKHFLLDRLAFRDNFFTHFCASMFSGFMTSLVSNPVDVVRTRIMTEYAPPGQPRTYSNPLTSLLRILRAEGPLGLYKGFVPSYLRLGSASVVVFMLYEQLRQLAGIPTM